MFADKFVALQDDLLHSGDAGKHCLFADFPLPSLEERVAAGIPLFTDDALFAACGVRIAFTTRAGGVSEGAYATLNFGSHVEDDIDNVLENRARFLEAVVHEDEILLPGGFETGDLLDEVLVIPKQVHGDKALTVSAPEDVAAVQAQAAEGADAIIVDTSGVGALLCFADCVPVIIALPTGRFAVIHAGWRGIANEISAKTLSLMLDQEIDELRQDVEVGEEMIASFRDQLVSCSNAYIGPYIHRECFETSPDVHQVFTSQFGDGCAYDTNHIDLGVALTVQLERMGIIPERISDLNACTVCNNNRFFSFRAQDGTAGRHGAFAIRA